MTDQRSAAPDDGAPPGPTPGTHLHCGGPGSGITVSGMGAHTPAQEPSRAAAIQLDGHDFDDLCDRATRWQGNETLRAQRGRFTSPVNEPIPDGFAVAYWFNCRADMVLARRFLTAIGMGFLVIQDLVAPGAYVVLADYLSPLREKQLAQHGQLPGPVLG